MEAYEHGENIFQQGNGQQINQGKYSEIMMDFEPEELGEQSLYESAHVDQLLETSFVEISTMGERLCKEEMNFNFNSGESFFKKTNQMFHSDLGNKQYRRMKNKKLQCDIGSGTVHESVNSSLVVQGKMRRLQILKMMKLVKIIFRHVRSFKEKIKADLCNFIIDNKRSIDQLLMEMNKMGSRHCEELGMKNMRILELQQQLAEISNMNQWLSHKIQSNQQESQQLIQQIEMEKHKSLAQIKDASMSASLKAEQIQEQNESLEHQIAYYQQEMQNLHQICNEHEVSIKKLQYENQKLQKENSSLFLRHQCLARQSQERQQNYNDLNSQYIGANEELSKLIKVNELYQRQLESTKQEINKLEQFNTEITKQTEQILFIQLNKYQESFNEQIVKLKKEHNNEIQNKNAIIQRLSNKQQKLLKTKSKSNYSTNNKVFKPVDSNSNKRMLKNQRQQDQHLESNSQSTISIKSVQNFTRIHLANKIHNKGGHSNEQNRCDPNKRVKNQAIHEQYLQKNNQIRQPDIIFKAKEHTAHLKIKLSDYMRQKQENMFFASDGMLQANLKASKKTNKVLMNEERQFLKAFRK